MLEMELRILRALEFRVASTTCSHFLNRLVCVGCEKPLQESLAFVRAYILPIIVNISNCMAIVVFM